jgi:hypothetical protein
MQKCIIEYIIHIAARLRNRDYRSGEIMDDTFKYILKFICFRYKIVSVIDSDIHALRWLTPDNVDHIMIVRPVNGTVKGNSLKMPIPLSRPYLSNESKDEDFSTDYNWTTQMDDKIICPGPTTCSITPSPAGTRPTNLRLFCLHSAVFIVKCAP